MRIDLALKYLCLVKSRSLVKSLCERRAVLLNGRSAKPSSELHVDDTVSIQMGATILTISVVNIPEKQLSKTGAPAYYRVVGREQANDSD